LATGLYPGSIWCEYESKRIAVFCVLMEVLVTSISGFCRLSCETVSSGNCLLVFWLNTLSLSAE